jgi:flagellar motility protein MotE (MotC chaperone)
MNKYVKLVGLVVASFAVINVSMFFFLRMTQPKMGARVDTAKIEHQSGSDSTTHSDAVKTDAEAHHEPAASATPAAKDSAQAVHEQAPVAASLAGEPPQALPPPPEGEKQLSSVDSTPVASKDSKEGTADTGSSVAAAVTGGDSKEMAKLAKLLESVKPDEAASIASELSVEQIVALVMIMKDRNAGKMLAALPADQAARVALRMTQMATATRGKP